MADDITDNELCALCGNGRQWHRENQVHHGFTLVEGELKENRKSQPPKPQQAQLPSDPILRYLLIEKGIITPDELTEAENKLKSLGSLVAKTPDATQLSLI